MTVTIINEKISNKKLRALAKESFEDMIKGVVDLHQKTIALGGELHADAEALLLQNGSKQADLWGFNIYVDKPSDERIEFSSFINIRPSHGNRSLEIEDEGIKKRITGIINDLVE